MSLENIRQLSKGLLNEGLNRNVYQKIIKDIELGIELEVIYNGDNIDRHGGDSDEQDAVIDFSSDLSYFKGQLKAFEEIADFFYDMLKPDTFKYLRSKGEKYVPHITEFSSNFEGSLYRLKNDVESELDERIQECEDIYDTYERYIPEIEDMPNKYFLEYTEVPYGEGHGNFTYPEDAEVTYEKEITEAKGKLLDVLGDRLIELYNQKYELDPAKKNTLHAVELTIDDYSGGGSEVGSEVGSEGGVDPDDVRRYLEDTTAGELMTEFEVEGLGQWSYETDSSLNEGGVELVSPVVGFDDFVNLIPQLCNALNAESFESDESCGYHIGLSSYNFNIQDMIKQIMDYYKAKGYNLLTSYIIATQQGYKATYRHNDKYSRDETTSYAESLMSWVGGHRLRSKSFDEILHSNEFDTEVLKFMNSKYSNTNLLHKNYVELRVLGGGKGFRVLRNESMLRKYLYDAISQVYGGIDFDSEGKVIVKEVSAKEIVKLVDFYVRGINYKGAPSSNPTSQSHLDKSKEYKEKRKTAQWNKGVEKAKESTPIKVGDITNLGKVTEILKGGEQYVINGVIHSARNVRSLEDEVPF